MFSSKEKCFTFTNSYEYYKNKYTNLKSNKEPILDKKTYRNVLGDVVMELSQELIKSGNRIYLPKGLGSFQVTKYRNTRIKEKAASNNPSERFVARMKWLPFFEWKKGKNQNSKSSFRANKGRYYVAHFCKRMNKRKKTDKLTFDYTVYEYFQENGWRIYDITTKTIKRKYY